MAFRMRRESLPLLRITIYFVLEHSSNKGGKFSKNKNKNKDKIFTREN